MAVDFELERVAGFRIASTTWEGPYSDRAIRARFETVVRWAKDRNLRRGRWVFTEPGTDRWQVGIEIFGTARSDEGIRVLRLPAVTVGRVVFDPAIVAHRVVWHGLNDWLRGQRKEGKIRRVVSYREVYRGDPWRSKSAWSKIDVQMVVKR